MSNAEIGIVCGVIAAPGEMRFHHRCEPGEDMFNWSRTTATGCERSRDHVTDERKLLEKGERTSRYCIRREACADRGRCGDFWQQADKAGERYFPTNILKLIKSKCSSEYQIDRRIPAVPLGRKCRSGSGLGGVDSENVVAAC